MYDDTLGRCEAKGQGVVTESRRMVTTSPGLGKTSPGLEKNSPGLGKTSPGLVGHGLRGRGMAVLPRVACRRNAATAAHDAERMSGGC